MAVFNSTSQKSQSSSIDLVTEMGTIANVGEVLYFVEGRSAHKRHLSWQLYGNVSGWCFNLLSRQDLEHLSEKIEDELLVLESMYLLTAVNMQNVKFDTIKNYIQHKKFCDQIQDRCTYYLKLKYSH